MRIGTVALAAVATLSCGSRPAPPEGMLARYRLDRAPTSRVTLPAALHEVSGLAVTGDGRLFAHGDEHGVVFQVDPATGKVVKRFSLQPGAQEVDLGKKSRDGRVAGDFEDIAVVGDRFFLVTSNGVLVEFREGQDGGAVPFTAYPTSLADGCEVEGLAHDPASDALLLLCKQMKDKAARHLVEIYSWSLRDRRLDPKPRLTVRVRLPCAAHRCQGVQRLRHRLHARRKIVGDGGRPAAGVRRDRSRWKAPRGWLRSTRPRSRSRRGWRFFRTGRYWSAAREEKDRPRSARTSRARRGETGPPRAA